MQKRYNFESGQLTEPAKISLTVATFWSKWEFNVSSKVPDKTARMHKLVWIFSAKQSFYLSACTCSNDVQRTKMALI